jgi:predicted small secreted protein
MPAKVPPRRLLALLLVLACSGGLSACGPLNTLKEVGRHTEEAEGR